MSATAAPTSHPHPPSARRRPWPVRLVLWILRAISDVTRFLLYSALFFFLLVAACYWVASRYFGGSEVIAPELVGLTMPEAAARLGEYNVGLVLESRVPHERILRDRIISQYPRSGVQIKTGSPIRVTISDGPPLVAVPEITGLNRIDAGIRLRHGGLDVGTVATIPWTDASGGMVLTSDPPPGTGVLEGSKVNLLLAAGEGAGERRMPNLLGLTVEEARQVLESYGIELSEAKEAPSPRGRAGQIVDQFPTPGKSIDPTLRTSVTYSPEQEEAWDDEQPPAPPSVRLDFGRPPPSQFSEDGRFRGPPELAPRNR